LGQEVWLLASSLPLTRSDIRVAHFTTLLPLATLSERRDGGRAVVLPE
jgi:hypothetical protein